MTSEMVIEIFGFFIDCTGDQLIMRQFQVQFIVSCFDLDVLIKIKGGLSRSVVTFRTDKRTPYVRSSAYSYIPMVGIFYGMMSSNANIWRITGHLCGEFTGHRWIPRQRLVTRSFDLFFDLRLNKRLNKQWWGWWFETPSRPLWRHSNGNMLVHCLMEPRFAWIFFIHACCDKARIISQD